MELEAALPVTDTVDTPEADLRAGEPVAVLPSPLDESSASHLAGVSAGEIETVDAKFQQAAGDGT